MKILSHYGLLSLIILGVPSWRMAAQNCIGTQTITKIHTIQGSGPASLLDGMHVTIEGIVTADFQTDTNKINGFFVQEEMDDVDHDPNTSEGILVFEGDYSLDVSPGDKVRVTGKVTEFFNLTEITHVESIEICPGGPYPLPDPTDLILPFSDATYLEKWENMLVHVPQDLYVTDLSSLDRGGFLVLTAQKDRLLQPTQTSTPGMEAKSTMLINQLNRIILDDGSRIQNPNPIIFPSPSLSPQNPVRGGDIVSNIIGILTYSNGGWNYGGGTDAFRIHPTRKPTFTPVNPRPEAGPGLDSDIIIGSLNLGNFFNGDGMGNQFPTSRGAKSFADFTRQKEKLALTIVQSQADIMGLMEMENDGYEIHSAIHDLVNAIGLLDPQAGYDFVNPGVSKIGGDEICVALIFKRSKLDIEPGTIPKILSDPGVFSGDASNRPVLAASFVVIDTASSNFGQSFTVAVNHFKSKGASTIDLNLCTQFPDSDLNCDQRDGQGYWNQKRTDAAQVLTTWLMENPTHSSSRHQIILGDLNAYRKEDPITTIEAAGFVNVTPNSYSYAFDAQWGTLDYIFVDSSLIHQIKETTIWHVNADEPDALDYSTQFNHPDLYAINAFRSSDHDPVLMGLQNFTSDKNEVRPIISQNQVTLFQNHPNPFKHYTFLDFYLPSPMPVRISVYDLTGKLYHVKKGFFGQGRQQVRLRLKDSPSEGLLYYRLDTESFSGIGKMVRMR